MKLGVGKEWFTAAELAELALPGLSRAKRKVNELAAAEGWAFRKSIDGAKLARDRKGRGGGTEYHIDVLPIAARSALLKRGIAAVAHISAQPEQLEDGRWRWFDAQSEKTKAEAQRRLKALQMVESYEQLGLTRSAAVTNSAARLKVGASTLWKWLELVNGVAPKHWLPHLAPQRAGGAVQAEVDPRIWQALISNYLRPEQPTFSSCYRYAGEIAASMGVAMPHERTLWRKLQRDVDHRVILRARMGAEALRRSLPSEKRSVADLHALEAVNIDGHKFDVFVKWPDGRIGRPIMVAVQDIYSRKILAWRLDESESALSTRLVFADLFKNWGIPKHCTLDNGRAFAAKSITGAAKSRFRFKIRDDEPTGVLTALGVEIHWAMPYRGQSKPIERAFRDLCDTIAKHPAVAGAYTGNRPDAKPENYGDRAIDIDTFRALVDRGIAAHNARDGRRTEMARGRSFDETFAESYAVSPIGQPATAEQLRLALLTAEERPCDRKTSHVTLEGNRYWAPELSAHAGEKLIVRFDPDNLHGSVHVYTRDDRYICEATCLAAVGFFDKAAAKSRAKMEADIRKLERSKREKLELIRAADLAAMLPDHIDESEPVSPTVVRPVRFVGNAALKLSNETHQAAAAARQIEQNDFTDRMAAGLAKLRAVD